MIGSGGDRSGDMIHGEEITIVIQLSTCLLVSLQVCILMKVSLSFDDSDSLRELAIFRNS